MSVDWSRVFTPTLADFPYVPRYYGCVIIAGAGSIVVNIAHIREVMQARKTHSVEYPLLYHPTNKEFNCVQRAHQNYLESLPISYVLLFVGGLRYPRTIAACYAVWLAGRLVYMKGYATGEPKNRARGKFGYLGAIPMVLAYLAFGIQHTVASIKGGCSRCY